MELQIYQNVTMEIFGVKQLSVFLNETYGLPTYEIISYKLNITE
jgi:hypothetical protein